MKRASLSVLKKRIVATQDATNATREKKRKRKATKKKAEIKPLVPDFGLEFDDC